MEIQYHFLFSLAVFLKGGGAVLLNHWLEERESTYGGSLQDHSKPGPWWGDVRDKRVPG